MPLHLDSFIRRYSDDLITAVCESIRIPSLNSEALPGKPYGENINLALEHALDVARRLGFKTVNLDGYVGYAEYGDGEEVVAAMGHLDIVPPGEGWTFDPYAGIVRDGQILGRGSQDDKGPLFSTLFALRALADSGEKITKMIRIIFGLDEELGKMRDVAAYIEREGAPLMSFTPDGEYPVVNAEKGSIKFAVYCNFKPCKAGSTQITLMEIHGGEGFGSVPARAQAVLSGNRDTLSSAEKTLNQGASDRGWGVSTEILGDRLKVIVCGKAAHATLPELGENAISRLCVLLQTVHSSYSLGKRGECVSLLADVIGKETDGASLGIKTEHHHTGKLTVNIGLIESTEESITFKAGIYVPAMTLPSEEVVARVKQAFEPLGAELEIISKTEPLFVDESHPLICALKRGYQNATGKEPYLISMCGGTYSKKMPDMVPFGATFKDEPDFAHAADERVLISNLLESARIMTYALLEMAK